MKKTLRLLLLTATFVGGELLLSSFSFSAPSLPYQIKVTIPAASLDMSDLDVRDAFNRPVRSARSQTQLADLFASNLNNMILKSLVPMKQRLLVALSTKWRAASGWLKQRCQSTQQRYDSWIQNKKNQERQIYSAYRSHLKNKSNIFKGRINTDSSQHSTYLLLVLTSTVLLR